MDLQTKTATFQSGMADAAKAARASFSDIKSGAGEMGGHVNVNMFAARHSVMALSEAFGGQLPRAITAFIAHLGPMGPALEAAFPFAAIMLGAVLLLEHLGKLQRAGVQLTEDQVRFGTAAANAFNALDQKILQAEIRSDELKNDHLGALRKELELIDKQSMAELAQTFGLLAKAADVALSHIESHWYTLGHGAEGAKASLEEITNTYEAFLAKGDNAGAAKFLQERLAREEKILALQKQAQATGGYTGVVSGGHMDQQEQVKLEEAIQGLKAMNAQWDKNAILGQERIVDALRDQVTMQQKIGELKGVQKGNATLDTSKEESALRSEGARQMAEHKQKMGEIALAAEREQTQALLDVHNASIMQRLIADMGLADKERDIQLKGNADLQAALDRGGKDYNNQLAALRAKAAEIEAQHGTAIEGLKSKAFESQYRLDIQTAEQVERAKIDATEQGSAARLAAIDAAIKAEQSAGMQNTQHYRELMTERVEVERAANAEAAKLAAEAGKLDAEAIQKSGELALAAEREKQALIESSRRTTIQQQLQDEMRFSEEEYALKMNALGREIAALDKSGKDYANKLRELQNQEKALTQAHENEITAIKDKAEIARNQRILSAESQFNDQIARGLTQVLMGHQSFASMMTSIGNQVVSGMMENAIKSVMANDFTKESDAAAAARKAYLAGMHFPFPVNIVMGPTLGALAFASVMAFQEGTDMVPGSGRGDTVPAMLEPGEGVVPGGVMDGLRSMVKNGGMAGGGTHYHAHVAPVYNLQALDTAGMEKMLDKHNGTIQKHVTNTLRKMNK